MTAAAIAKYIGLRWWEGSTALSNPQQQRTGELRRQAAGHRLLHLPAGHHPRQYAMSGAQVSVRASLEADRGTGFRWLSSAAQRNAEMPVMCWPRISMWTSSVPS